MVFFFPENPGTLVSEPFIAAVRGSEGTRSRWFTEQFRTHLLSPRLPYSSRANVTARSGPTLPTWAQVGGYPGYTGRDANIVSQAALDPKPSAPGKLAKDRR